MEGGTERISLPRALEHREVVRGRVREGEIEGGREGAREGGHTSTDGTGTQEESTRTMSH